MVISPCCSCRLPAWLSCRRWVCAVCVCLCLRVLSALSSCKFTPLPDKAANQSWRTSEPRHLRPSSLSGSITHWVPVITFLAVWLYSQQCQLVDFGWSTTFVQAEKWREWDTRNHGPKRVNSTDFGDPLTFHPAPSSAQIWNCPILWFMTKYFKKKNFSRQPLTPLNLYLLNMLWVFHHAEISI